MKTRSNLHFKALTSQQIVLFPSNIGDRIPSDHPVRIVNQVVDSLNIDDILSGYKGGGTSSFHPRMLIKVLFYSYFYNIYSCRKMAQALQENIHFMWLSGNSTPDFRTINNFRGKRLSEYIGTTCVGCETASVLSHNGKLTVNCGGGSDGGAPGQGGGTPTVPPGTTTSPEIINTITNTCLNYAVFLASNYTAKTTITNMLNTTFGGNTYSDWELKFTQSSYLASDVNGTATQDGNRSIIVQLNTNLVDRSREFTVATVYHEVLHALLFTNQTKVNGVLIISDQHEVMAEQYVALLTGSLRTIFPSLSLQEAWGLAWGGLQDTNLYTTKLTADQRAEIVTINNNHRRSVQNGQRAGEYCPQ